MTALLKAALGYAARGIPVLPVKPRGKEPVTDHAYKDATTDENTIRGWWKKWLKANIGLVPGPAKLVVVDIDGSEAMEFARERGWLDIPTPRVVTKNGLHLYFLKTSEEVIGNAGPHPKIDIRCDKGYVVAPPSIHSSGHVYSWENEELEFSLLPEDVQPAVEARKASEPLEGGTITEGGRNDTLFLLGCTMRGSGLEEPEILAALLEINRGRCDPPLPEHEVRQIAANAASYEPGSPSLITLDDFHSYLPEHKYIFVPTGAMWPAPSINVLLGKVGKGKKAVPANVWLDQNRSVEQMSWDPGRAKLVENQLMSDGGWFDKLGVKCFNLYKPPTIKPGDPRKAVRWIKHVRLVYGKAARHIIRWFAHRLQRPGEKINHALVLQGAQGTGKDTIVEGVIPGIGPWNCQEVSPEQILGGFNSFLESVIIRVSEARDLGDRDRYRFFDHMKTYIAAPPMVLRVNKKHLREYQIPNVCGVIITTNYVDGVYLSADDRRHFVAWTEKTKEDFDEEYWNDLYAWFEREGYRNVAAYLARLDISDFNPKAPPPKTDAFWAVVDAGRAPEDAEFADVLDQLGGPDAVTLSMLVAKAEENFDSGSEDDFATWLRDRRNNKKIRHRMEGVGYLSVRNKGAKDGRWKIGGKNVVVYSLRELSVRERIEAAERLVAEARS